MESFSVPHDAVEPVGFTFHAGRERARLHHRSRTGDSPNDRKIARSADAHDRDESRRKTFAERSASAVAGKTTDHCRATAISRMRAAAAVIEQLLPGKLARVVLGHLSRDCNSPALPRDAVAGNCSKGMARRDDGSFLRRSARDQRALSDWAKRRRRVSADFREHAFSRSARSGTSKMVIPRRRRRDG